MAKFFGVAKKKLLTEPFLQLPTQDSVYVVWFTGSKGDSHQVEVGKKDAYRFMADSRQLSRLRNDIKTANGKVKRSETLHVWRHEALVTGLRPGERQLYRVVSKIDDQQIASKYFTLCATPQPGQPMKILLTSDHQRKPMVAANLQKAIETIGRFDAVFCAGDQVEIPDGYLDWFTDMLGFFPCLQGKGQGPMEGKMYVGGEILQHTPFFPAIGNHEVMGRYSSETSLHHQIGDPYPLEKARKLHQKASERKLVDLSFNSDTYEQIFRLPKNDTGRSHYYAISLGDVRLIVLCAVRIWRSPSTDPLVKGKYQESEATFQNSQEWGYGDFIFESLEKGSKQYEWLIHELKGQPFIDAKLRVVMLHNPLHTLGENGVPPFAHPIQSIQKDLEGRITAIHYAYPIKEDILIKDLEPLLEKYGVDLVFNGHSHVWNRFQSKKGMHYLESSNVGNSYGAYTKENGKKRDTGLFADPKNYVAQGDPNGLEPIIPTIAPMKDEQGHPMPYISSEHITVFSVLDTGKKLIESYYFDCRNPERGVVKFDAFNPYRQH